MSRCLAGRPPPERVALVAAVVGAGIRVIYVVLAGDPMSGPDSDTYHAAGSDFARRGVLAEDVTGVPYWPAGYPLLVGGIYELLGDTPRAVSVLQAIALGAAAYAAYRLVAREVGPQTGAVTAVLMAASPALVAVAAPLMYEPFLVATLVVGAERLSASRHRSSVVPGIVGATALGLAVTLQPKALLAAVPLVVITSLRLTRRSAAIPLVLALAFAPALLGLRTWVAHGEFALSANTGVNLAIGLHADATGYYRPSGIANECYRGRDVFEQDRALARCAIEFAVENPVDAAALMPAKATYFWAPFPPVPVSHGTWHSDISYRRLFPAGDDPIYDTFDRVGQWIWMFALVMLVMGGAVSSYRQAGPVPTAFLGIPLLAFLAVSLVTFGEPRLRLPVAPFYSAFVGLALVAIARSPVWKRKVV